MQTARISQEVKSYIFVTICYWTFTLTDGALRMLVLLHFHQLGFSPLELSMLFLLYEICGVFTNLFGGLLATRFGLHATLLGGLLIQVLALVMLSFVDASWTAATSVLYVMFSQALSGIAKDLTKMSSKSAIKFLAGGEDGERTLFRWVALLTGSKNALKGFGFFAGALSLYYVGFAPTLWILALCLLCLVFLLWFRVDIDMGRAAKKPTFTELLSKSREINFLSAARLFLFAARDTWFVVAVPVYLYEVLKWSFSEVGGFLAVWVIGYGIVQALVPQFAAKDSVKASETHSVKESVRSSVLTQGKIWGLLLVFVPALIAFCLGRQIFTSEAVIGGLIAFGIVFAVNSSIHSYLIVSYSAEKDVILNVGFYYMANALGRLLGTLLSGSAYLMVGLEGCLLVCSGLALLAVGFMFFLPQEKATQSLLA